MARGPVPKDPERRKRRNATLPMTHLPRGVFPEDVPTLPGRSKFCAATKRWYETWTRSEQATKFGATDWQRLHMLAPVVDAYHRRLAAGQVSEAAKLLSHIERTEARFGATADDRQRLRWSIDDDAAAAKVPARAPSRARGDPRHLAAVK